MRTIRAKPYRRCVGYIVRALPREDGLLSIVEVNPASHVVTFAAGEKLVAASEKLLALAEQCCQEQAPVVYRGWPHKDHVELIELYRQPSDGWHPIDRMVTEVF